MVDAVNGSDPVPSTTDTQNPHLSPAFQKFLDRKDGNDKKGRGWSANGADSNRADPRISVADAPFSDAAPADSGGYLSVNYGKIKFQGAEQKATFVDAGGVLAKENARFYAGLNADFPSPKDGTKIYERLEGVAGFGTQIYLAGDEDDPKAVGYLEGEGKAAFLATPLDPAAVPVVERHRFQFKAAAGLVLRPNDKIAFVLGAESRGDNHGGPANGFAVQDEGSKMPRTDNLVLGVHYRLGRSEDQNVLSNTTIGFDFRPDIHITEDAAGNSTRASQFTFRASTSLGERLQVSAATGIISQLGGIDNAAELLTIKGSYWFGGRKHS
jgi:hypothetical protein